MPFHPLHSNPSLSWSSGGPSWCMAFLGGRGWTSVPRGHRARGEGPRSLKTAGLSKTPLRFVPRAPPHLLGVS